MPLKSTKNKVGTPKIVFRPLNVKRVADPTLSYQNAKNTGRGVLTPAEYDLAEVGRIEDVESFVRQAFEKKTALMFKEGWYLRGKNPKTLKYIRERFTQIERATNTPTGQLFRDIGRNLFRLNNAHIVKVRNQKSSGGAVRKIPGTNRRLEPVAGYFSVGSETMRYKLNDSGRISIWQQVLPDGTLGREWSPDNIVHFTHDKKLGFVFGTPLITPVIDDIRALRKIEENLELLVYQHLFPLFQYKIGDMEHKPLVTEDGESEIDVARREIQYMPSEGGIVTPGWHEVKMVGAEGKALRAEGILEHFKKRVLGGLGLSGVDVGEGSTVNRATSQTMSQNLINGVKDIQRTMSLLINEHIINELLLESTFDFDPLEEENVVRFEFYEVDIDAKVKKETHFADMFAKNIIDFDEARAAAGLEPILLPTNRETETDPYLDEKYGQWYKTHWKLIQEPMTMIQSVDEPFSPISKAVVSNNSIDITKKDVDEGQKAALEKMKQEGAIKKDLETVKQKAKTAQARAKPKVKDSVIEETFDELKTYLIQQVISYRNTGINRDWFHKVVKEAFHNAATSFATKCRAAFTRGYIAERGPQPATDRDALRSIKRSREIIDARIHRYANKLSNEIDRHLSRHIIDVEDWSTAQGHITAIFDSLRYRTIFIEDVEYRKAVNLGTLAALKDKGFYSVEIHCSDDPCDRCKAYDGQVVPISEMRDMLVPPFHAGCDCKIGNPQKLITENADAEDSAKKEKCILSVKADLRKRHPDWTEKQVKSAAFAICSKRVK